MNLSSLTLHSAFYSRANGRTALSRFELVDIAVDCCSVTVPHAGMIGEARHAD